MTWTTARRAEYATTMVCSHRGQVGLHNAVQAIQPTLETMSFDGSSLITADFSIDVSAPSQIAVDAVVADFTGGLNCAKIEKRVAIDKRTKELILLGFTHLGIVFSSSQAAQDTIEGYHRSIAALTFPIWHHAKDDTQSVELSNAADVNAMHDDLIVHIAGHRNSGGVLKNSVNSATTEAAVDAVVDTR